jgi:6-phosphogluconolactonase/glucosamine-6-phosphate isomerase/deaminase
MFDHRPGTSVPASMLRQHERLTVLVDRDAASALRSEDVPIVEEG